MNEKPILITDDERNIRLTLARTIEDMGFQTIAAVNGEEALELLRIHPVSIVLLDLKMPGISGMEVLRQLADIQPGAKTVIITAHGSVPSAVEAMKLGAVDFIQKPFTPREIREIIERIFERENLEQNAENLDYEYFVQVAKRQITMRDFDGAEHTVRQALAKNPAHPESYNMLGLLLELRGERLEAQKYYRAALAVDPTFEPADQNLKRVTEFGGNLPPKISDELFTARGEEEQSGDE